MQPIHLPSSKLVIDAEIVNISKDDATATITILDVETNFSSSQQANAERKWKCNATVASCRKVATKRDEFIPKNLLVRLSKMESAMDGSYRLESW